MSRKTRKLMWSVPLIAAVAVIGALAAFMTLGINPAQAHDPPGAVTGLTLEVVSSMEVKLSWTAPTTGGAVDSYRIDKSDEGLVWTLLTDTVSGDSTSYTDDTLEFTGVRFYRVLAVNDSGTGAVSEAEGAQTQASMQPGRVPGLTAAPAPGNAGRKEIVLTWNKPATTGGSPIEKYHVYYTTPADTAFVDRGTDATGPTITAGTTRIAVTEDASLTYTHKVLADGTTALSPNSSYRYRVYAVNKAGQVSAMASDTRGATTKKVGSPDAPTGLTAVATGTSGQIQLYWYHPADDGGQDVTNFRIHQRSGTETWPDPDTADTDDQVTNEAAKDAANVTEATITGLTDGTSYQFRVYSVTGAEPNFVFSNAYAGTVSVTPVDAQAVPDAPTFTGTRDAKGVVTLNWTRATDVLSYRIDVSDNGWEWNKLIESTGFTDAQYTYKDPKRGAGVERHYRMFARNRHGYSGTPNAITVGVTDATAPGMVRGLTATPDPNDPTKINLNWMAPSDDGGATIAGYCIDYAVIERPSFVRLATTNSENFDAQVLSTVVPTNDAPCADTDVVDDLTAADDAVGARVKIEVKIPEAGDLPTPPTSYTVEDLKAQDTVQFRVVSQNLSIANARMYSAIGDADLVTAMTIKAAQPNMPQDLTAEAARDSNLPGSANLGVNLLWNVPEAVHGGNIVGYRIQVHYDAIRWWDSLNCAEMNEHAGSNDIPGEGYCQMYKDLTDAEKAVVMGAYDKAVSDDKVWMDVEANTGTTQTFDTHRSEPASGEVRMYRVAAIDNAAVTKQSDWSNVVTYPAQMHSHLPGMPQSVSAMVDADNATTINVSWMAADANGSAITSYMVQRGTMGSDGMMSWMNVSPAHSGMDMMYADSGLMGNTKYYYRVRAMNANGYGEYSDGMASAMTGDVAPNMPTSVMAAVDDTDVTKINVSWGAPMANGGSDVTGYMVQRAYEMSDGTMSDWMNVPTVFPPDRNMDMMHMDMGLMPNTKYYYRVAAMNAAGDGEYSDGMAYAMTGDVVPNMPTSVMAEVDATDVIKINVSWGAPTANGGSDVTGYVLERKMGDGDFMVIAATDAKTWWNTLDCPMMNDAVPADSNPAPGPDDMTSPYCKMYDGLMDDAKMVVDATFMENYDTITGMSYMDEGLMPETKYYYRVSAQNGAGTGMASDGMASAMTGSVVLTAPTNVMATATEPGELTLTWEGAQGADFYILLAVDVNTRQYDRARVNDGAARMGNVTGLDAGTGYLGIVIAVKQTEDGSESEYDASGVVTVQ